MAGFVKYYELLLQKAAVDQKSASILYNNFQNGNSELDFEVILFHLQQAAEKCLKALLSFHQVHFPKTHDIEELLNLVTENNISLNIDTHRLIDLSDYAVEGRYSVIHDDLAETNQYFLEVSLLYQQVKDLLSDK